MSIDYCCCSFVACSRFEATFWKLSSVSLLLWFSLRVHYDVIFIVFLFFCLTFFSVKRMSPVYRELTARIVDIFGNRFPKCLLQKVLGCLYNSSIWSVIIFKSLKNKDVNIILLDIFSFYLPVVYFVDLIKIYVSKRQGHFHCTNENCAVVSWVYLHSKS